MNPENPAEPASEAGPPEPSASSSRPRPWPEPAGGSFGARPPARPRLSPWVILAVVFACCGCLFFGVVGVLGALVPGAAASSGSLVEQVVDGQGNDKIALIELNGVIARRQSSGIFGVAGADLVESITKQLKRAGDDTTVKGVLLAIDSPGGTVTASDEIHHAIEEFRKQTNKPVVVSMGAICASGGYYIAVSADKLVCEPTSITGSIGVILSTYNFSELMQKYGVQGVTITSGKNKDLLNPAAPVRDEQLQIVKAMVMDSYQRFTQLVADGRGIPVEDVRSFADGRIYTPTEALKLKLIDSIGYRADARKVCEKLAGIMSSKLVRYTHPPSLAEVLTGASSSRSVPSLQLGPETLDRLGAPRLLALWRPAR